jgi:Tol biopolymer transport system component
MSLYLRILVALVVCSAAWIVFAQTVARILPKTEQILYSEPYTNRLYLMDVQRGLLSPLTVDGGIASWSPDGQSIVLVGHRLSGAEVVIFDLTTGALRELTDSPSYDGSPAWSPDGQQIAFISARDGDYDLYLMNADGSNVRNLTNNYDYDNNPTWSPDSRYVAFESNRTGHGAIYIMDVTQADLPTRALTDGQIWASNPAWSPDGTRIAFEYYVNSYADIYVMNVDGTGLQDLTNFPDGHDLNPTWSIDSQRIAFVSSRYLHRQIYVVDADFNAAVEPFSPDPLTSSDSDKGDLAWQP